jgi:PleD family two-component response regulator
VPIREQSKGGAHVASIRRSSSPLAEPSMPDAPQDTPPRILVVDDEQVIREILADFLSMEGFSVGTATDGASALA